ncbi:MAG: GNAT family N-acetyltransferase [Vicinamibacterales bacterium]
MTLRDAVAADVPALVRLINRAYLVEREFKAGDRTDASEVRALLAAGTFIVAPDVAPDAALAAVASDVALQGCAYVAVAGDRAKLALLSVDPDRQGRGIGGRLIAAVEARARDAGCREIAIQVVNRRRELFPFYEKRGYVARGTDPFEDPSLLAPCHFVRMAKPLDAAPRPREDAAPAAT